MISRLLVSIPFCIPTWCTHFVHPGYPSGSIVLIQTTSDYFDARNCHQNSSSPMFTLLNMHPQSKARIPRFVIIPQHQPFISAFINCLAKLLAQRKNFNNQPSCSLDRSPHLFIHPFRPTSLPFCLAFLHATQKQKLYVFLSVPPFSLPFPLFPTLLVIVPPTSPHQCNSTPHHHSRRLFPALHNTQTKRKASPCIALQP